jgi:hypothetical protein
VQRFRSVERRRAGDGKWWSRARRRQGASRRSAPSGCGLDAGSARDGEAIIAGPPPVPPDEQGDAIPLAIEDSMGSSLGVSPTRETGGIAARVNQASGLDGYRVERLEWEAEEAHARVRMWIESRGGAAMSARGVAAAPGRSAMPRNGPGTTCRGPRTQSRWSIGSAGYDVGPAGFAPSRWGSPMVTRASRAGCAS